MPQRLPDMFILAMPCVMGVVVFGSAVDQMVRNRRWWFTIPMLFALCGLVNLLAVLIKPDLENSLICPGAMVIILIGALLHIVIRRIAQFPIAPAGDGGPPIPPADPPQAPPS